ncbi:unnamed protein product [Amoebophrya sp. A25]|nr:unnamed protein product [Amoebophrya sp. A25]|eukprot:GSA25T00021701001.1
MGSWMSSSYFGGGSERLATNAGYIAGALARKCLWNRDSNDVTKWLCAMPSKESTILCPSPDTE